MTRRKLFTDEQIIDALRKAVGIQRAAAKILTATYGKPCSRSQIHARISKSPRLREALRVIEEENKDMAESKLYTAIKKGQSWAVTLYLRSKARDRGYGDRIEHSSPGGGPVQHEHKHEHKIDFDTMSVEEIDAYIAARAHGPATH